MKKLVHGGDIYSAKKEIDKKIYDFSANINPLGVPQGIIDAVANSLADCANYPDPLCRDLVDKLSIFEEVPKEYILCGNGAADIIFRLALCHKPKKALVTAPTFAEYQQALSVVDCKVAHHILKEEENFCLTERILDDITEDLDMMFICNPNNPTGAVTEPSLLRKILKKAEELDILIVVDECFIEFLDEPQLHTIKEFLASMKNLVILKAFTKNYAMAGFRLGYCLSSNKELLERLTEMGQPWSVSIPAQVAGLAALKEEEYVNKAMSIIREERKRLVAALKDAGFKVFEPMANYIFFKIEELPQKNSPEARSLAFRKAMRGEGFLIRDCGNYVGLTDEFSRIAVRNKEENLAFIDAMTMVLKEME